MDASTIDIPGVKEIKMSKKRSSNQLSDAPMNHVFTCTEAGNSTKISTINKRINDSLYKPTQDAENHLTFHWNTGNCHQRQRRFAIKHFYVHVFA